VWKSDKSQQRWGCSRAKDFCGRHPSYRALEDEEELVRKTEMREVCADREV
jgi:hypothetical protein